MTKKADNQKLDKELDINSIISDRGYILHRQKIAEGAIEFMRSKEWKYLVLSKDAGAAEVKRRNTLYASRVYLEEIPKKGVPKVDGLQSNIKAIDDVSKCFHADRSKRQQTGGQLSAKQLGKSQVGAQAKNDRRQKVRLGFIGIEVKHQPR